MSELILSSDTLNIGRIAINNWYSGSTNIWTANTNNTVWLITGNTTAGSSTGGFSLGSGNTISSGAYGITLNGVGNTASNNFATVANGRGNVASSTYSFVGNGTGNTANGARSFVGNGKNNTGQAAYAFIGNGGSNKVLNNFSTIVNGKGNRAYSNYSMVVGGNSNSIANSSSFYGTILNGKSNLMLSNSLYSTIINGKSNLISNSAYALVFGKSNTVSAAYSIAIGNGASTSTAKQMVFAGGAGNTIRIDFNSGEFFCDTGLVGSPADYSEYFEWEDGNLNDEKRYGLSVSLASNGRVKIGNENIIGIVSSNPVIVGDAAELSWKNKYKFDEWGIKQFEVFDKVSILRDIEGEKKIINLWIDKNGKQYSSPPRNQKERLDYFIDEFYELAQEEIESKQKDLIYLYSEEYDPKSEYIPRSERKEFSTIGLLGKLRVRTAEHINSEYVDFNSQGMAINGSKYRILERIKDYDGQYGIVKIFFK